MATELVTFGYKWADRPDSMGDQPDTPAPGALGRAPGSSRGQGQGQACRLEIDVRSFRNPWEAPQLRGRDGRDPDVARYVENGPNFEEKYTEVLIKALTHDGPVWIGCTGGRHRSVVIGERLARDLAVPVRHRDIDRD